MFILALMTAGIALLSVPTSLAALQTRKQASSDLACALGPRLDLQTFQHFSSGTASHFSAGHSTLDGKYDESCADRDVLFVERQSGAKQWGIVLPDVCCHTRVSFDGRLAIVQSRSSLTAVNMDRGETVWTRPVSASAACPAAAPVISCDGTLYFAEGRSGVISAVGMGDGSTAGSYAVDLRDESSVLLQLSLSTSLTHDPGQPQGEDQESGVLHVSTTEGMITIRNSASAPRSLSSTAGDSNNNNNNNNDVIGNGSADATETATSFATASASATATATSTTTSTATATATSTATGTATKTGTSTGTYTLTQTSTGTATSTATATATSTYTGSQSATSTASSTRTSTSTATSTSSSTSSATSTHSATATATRTASSTATRSAVPTASATATSTSSSTRTASATATASATSSRTAVSTKTATKSSAPTATATPSASSTPLPPPKWGQTRHDARNTGRSGTGRAPPYGSSVMTDWITSDINSQNGTCTPFGLTQAAVVGYDSSVYIGPDTSAGGVGFRSFDGVNGLKRWNNSDDKYCYSTAALSATNDVVVVASWLFVEGLRASTGALLWRYTRPYHYCSCIGPTISGRTAIIVDGTSVGADPSVVALDIDTGVVRWTAPAVAPYKDAVDWSFIAVDANRSVVHAQTSSGGNAYLVSFSLTNGTVLNVGTFPGFILDVPPMVLSDGGVVLWTTPSVYDGTGSMICYNPFANATASVLWTQGGATVKGGAVMGKHDEIYFVYRGADQAYLVVMDSRTGTINASVAVGAADPPCTAPLVMDADGLLYFSNYSSVALYSTSSSSSSSSSALLQYNRTYSIGVNAKILSVTVGDGILYMNSEVGLLALGAVAPSASATPTATASGTAASTPTSTSSASATMTSSSTASATMSASPSPLIAGPKWPQMRNDVSNSGRTNAALGPAVSYGQPWTTAWIGRGNTQAPPGYIVPATPAIGADSTVYFGSAGLGFQAFNATSGALMWNNSEDSCFTSPAITQLGQDPIIIMQGALSTRAVRASNGVTVWSVLTLGCPAPAPVVYGSTVFVANGSSIILALDLFSGHYRYNMTVSTGVALSSNGFQGATFAIDASRSTLYTLTFDTANAWAILLAFSIDNGTLSWSYNFGSVGTTTLTVPPSILSNGNIIITFPTGVGIFCVSPITRNPVWSVSTIATTALIIDLSDRIYFVDNTPYLNCIDGRSGNGATVWRVSIGFAPTAAMSPVMDARGVIYFGSSVQVYAFSSVDGTQLGVYSTASSATLYSLSIGERMLFAVSNDGIFAIGNRAPSPTATASATTSSSASATATSTVSSSSSGTASSTASATVSSSASALASIPTATASATSTKTTSASATSSATGTSTATLSAAATPTAAATQSATMSAATTSTATASATATSTASSTSSATATSTASATRSATATASSTATASATDSTTASGTAISSASASSTATTSGTATASGSATSTPSCTPSSTPFKAAPAAVIPGTSPLIAQFAWTTMLPAGIQTSPAMSNGSPVFVGADDGTLFALHPYNGAVIWSYATEFPIMSSPTLYQDTVIFGSNSSCVTCLRQTSGVFLWKYCTGDAVVSTPVVDSQGTIYIGSTDHYVYAIKWDGTMLWQTKTAGSVSSTARLDEAAGVVYIGSDDYLLYALQMSTGTQVWTTAAILGGVIRSRPVLDSSRQFVYVYSGSDSQNGGGGLYKISTADGTISQKWTYFLPLNCTPSIVTSALPPYQTYVAVGTNNGTTVFVNVDSGATDWQFGSGSGPVYGPGVSPDGSTLFMGAADGSISGVLFDSPASFNVYLPYGAIRGSPIAPSPVRQLPQYVYAATVSGRVFAIERGPGWSFVGNPLVQPALSGAAIVPFTSATMISSTSIYAVSLATGAGTALFDTCASDCAVPIGIVTSALDTSVLAYTTSATSTGALVAVSTAGWTVSWSYSDPAGAVRSAIYADNALDASRRALGTASSSSASSLTAVPIDSSSSVAVGSGATSLYVAAAGTLSSGYFLVGVSYGGIASYHTRIPCASPAFNSMPSPPSIVTTSTQTMVAVTCASSLALFSAVDGTLQWSVQPAPGYALTAPIQGSSTDIIVGAGDGNVYGIFIVSGATVWSMPAAAVAATSASASASSPPPFCGPGIGQCPPVLSVCTSPSTDASGDHGIAYATTSTSLIAFAIDYGTPNWSQVITTGTLNASCSVGDYISSSGTPAAVYVGDSSGYAYAFNPINGTLLWRYDTSTGSSSSAGGGGSASRAAIVQPLAPAPDGSVIVTLSTGTFLSLRNVQSLPVPAPAPTAAPIPQTNNLVVPLAVGLSSAVIIIIISAAAFVVRVRRRGGSSSGSAKGAPKGQNDDAEEGHYKAVAVADPRSSSSPWQTDFATSIHEKDGATGPTQPPAATSAQQKRARANKTTGAASSTATSRSPFPGLSMPSALKNFSWAQLQSRFTMRSSSGSAGRNGAGNGNGNVIGAPVPSGLAVPESTPGMPSYKFKQPRGATTNAATAAGGSSNQTASNGAADDGAGVVVSFNPADAPVIGAVPTPPATATAAAAATVPVSTTGHHRMITDTAGGGAMALPFATSTPGFVSTASSISASGLPVIQDWTLRSVVLPPRASSSSATSLSPGSHRQAAAAAAAGGGAPSSPASSSPNIAEQSAAPVQVPVFRSARSAAVAAAMGSPGGSITTANAGAGGMERDLLGIFAPPPAIASSSTAGGSAPSTAAAAQSAPRLQFKPRAVQNDSAASGAGGAAGASGNA